MTVHGRGATDALPAGAASTVLRADGFELAAVTWPGAGPALVLLHGLGGNALVWADLVAALPGRRIVALDLPGHGRSPAGDSFALRAIASAVARVVQGLLQDRAIFVGHSWGGKLALAVLDAAPASRGLVLVDATPVPRFDAVDHGAMADDLFEHEYGPWSSLPDAHEAIRNLPQYTPWCPARVRAFARGSRIDETGRVTPVLTRATATAIIADALGADLAASAAAVKTPVLIVKAIDESGARWDPNRAAFPHARYRTLRGNHWLPTHVPEALAATISAWLDEQGL